MILMSSSLFWTISFVIIMIMTLLVGKVIGNDSIRGICGLIFIIAAAGTTISAICYIWDIFKVIGGTAR